MAKIAVTETKRFEVPETGRYKYRLTRCINKNVASSYGTSPRFIWIFTLTHKSVKSDDGAGKVTYKWEPVTTADGSPLQVSRRTNQAYGNERATFTKFLPELIREHADDFMQKCGDTDNLLGRRGRMSIQRQISKQDNLTPFVVILAIDPDEEDLMLWAEHGYNGEPELIRMNETYTSGNRAAVADDDDFGDPFED